LDLFQSLTLLAFNPLQPVVNALHAFLGAIYGVLHNYGWSLIALALIVKAAFWPLNTFQFKSLLKTQELAPRVKALQARFKNDREKLNEETMKLYKESGANPLAGCLPLLLQIPILISLYQAVTSDSKLFAQSTWLWIGSAFSKTVPNGILAVDLSKPDYALLALYVVSMYFQVRFSSPAMDEQQAQQQRIMSFISPAMIGYLGFRYHWPSALVLYWLSFNLFTMAQQFYLINKYHRNPLAAAGGAPAVATKGEAKALADGASANGAAGQDAKKTNQNGTPSARGGRKRRSRR
jgi:YidC/Oxa1 family membrane protein insertase